MAQPELLTALPPSLLRGVPLHVCLSGWAWHWRPPDPGMLNVDTKIYDLSHATDVIDDFLSHDWGTSRWMKLSTMLVIYNSRAALIATFITAILTSVFRIYGYLPNERWTVCVGYVVHALFLCFWQRVRWLVASPLMVFLDKLCIAQSAEQAELKKMGILGLAAFLNHSRRLVVFWSPRYFSRLWCAYEIATFLTEHNQQKPIMVIPVQAGHILLGHYIFWSSLSTVFWLSLDNYARSLHSSDPGFWNGPMGTILLVTGPGLLLGIPTSIAILRLFWHLSKVPEQLRTFQMQNTQCFCCSNNHRHPDTGGEIPCDRELVYRRLQGWYGQPSDTGQEFLLRFDLLVRERLGQTILSKMPGAIPLKYYLQIMCAANLPWLSDTLERLLYRLLVVPGLPDQFYHNARFILEWLYVSMVFLLGPFVILVLAPLMARLNRYVPPWFATLLVLVMNIALVFGWLAGCLFSFYFMFFAWMGTWYLIIPFIVVLSLNVGLFFWRSRLSGSPATRAREVKVEPKQLMPPSFTNHAELASSENEDNVDLELSANNADLEFNHVENVDRNLASASKPERVFTSTEASPQDTPSVQAGRSKGSFHSGQDSVFSA